MRVMSKAWAKGAGDHRWRNFRAAILLRDGYKCQIRGRGCTITAPLRGGHVDHITPLGMGGDKYDPMNVRAACAWCNRHRVIVIEEEPEPTRVSNW